MTIVFTNKLKPAMKDTRHQSIYLNFITALLTTSTFIVSNLYNYRALVSVPNKHTIILTKGRYFVYLNYCRPTLRLHRAYSFTLTCVCSYFSSRGYSSAFLWLSYLLYFSAGRVCVIGLSPQTLTSTSSASISDSLISSCLRCHVSIKTSAMKAKRKSFAMTT